MIDMNKKKIPECKFHEKPNLKLNKCTHKERKPIIGYALGILCPFRQFCKFYKPKKRA